LGRVDERHYQVSVIRMTRWINWHAIGVMPYTEFTTDMFGKTMRTRTFLSVREYMKHVRTQYPQYDWKSIKLSGYGWDIQRTRWPRDEE